MVSCELWNYRSFPGTIRRWILKGIGLGLTLFISVGAPRKCPAQALSQPQQQPIITLQSRSELVQVPVVVTDAKGRRVNDLSADEFTILENSRTVAIKHFERIRGMASPSSNQVVPGLFSNAPAATTSPPSITIFLLDSLNSTAADQKKACEEMSKILSSPVSGPTAIWQLGQKGITVVQDFTSAQKELVAALQRVVVQRSAQDQLNTSAVADYRPYFVGRGERDYSGYGNSKIDLDTEEGFNRLAVQDADQMTGAVMLRIARALRNVEGRKSLIWATGTLSSSIEDEIATALTAANVAVYPIELTATRNPRGSPVSFNNRVRYRKTEANGLKNVAAITGGSYCAYADAAPGCVTDAITDSSEYYLLSFAIDSRELKPGPHEIHVRVRDPQLRVRARTAYFVEDGFKQNSASRWLEIESSIDSPVDYTALPFAVHWVGRRDEKNKLHLSFRYVLPQGTLEVHAGNGISMNISCVAVAFTKEGKPAGNFSQEVAGTLSSDMTAQVREHGLAWEGAIDVEPTASKVRFVVRDNLTGRIGSLSAPVLAP